MNQSVPIETIEIAEASGHTCNCGEHAAAAPVLDVRQIPHAIRHGAVFGALEQLGAGGVLALVAPHNPLPLLNQLAQRWPIDIAYLEDGPAAWQLRITRRA